MTAKVKYASAARAPKSIDVTCVYNFGKDADGYYLEHGSNRIRVHPDFVTAFFAPIDATWSTILNQKKPRATKSKRNKKEAID